MSCESYVTYGCDAIQAKRLNRKLLLEFEHAGIQVRITGIDSEKGGLRANKVNDEIDGVSAGEADS